MALALLKLFFSGVATLSNLASFIVFNGSALVVVIFLRLLQIPGAIINCLLCLFKEQVNNMFKSLGDGLSSAASSGSTIVGNYLVSGMSNFTATAVNTVSEVVKGPEIYNVCKEIGKSSWEMVANISSSNWVNFLKAAKLIMENAH